MEHLTLAFQGILNHSVEIATVTTTETPASDWSEEPRGDKSLSEVVPVPSGSASVGNAQSTLGEKLTEHTTSSSTARLVGYDHVVAMKTTPNNNLVTDVAYSIAGNSPGGHPMASTSREDSTTVYCQGIFCFEFYNNASFFNWTGLNAFTESPEDSLALEEESRTNWPVLLLGIPVLAGIMGNILVCMAICMEKKLQNVTNYFLMSLAVADLLVSVIVMPLSIVNELLGYWPMGLVMCDLWTTADVMLCTSSILHMCTISLDRYLGIRNPLKTRNKSTRIVVIKIAAVWIISMAISSPTVVLGIIDERNVLNDGICGMANFYFIIYGSISAFFIPLIIMVSTNMMTVQLLRKQAALCSGKDGSVAVRRSTSRKKGEETNKKTLSWGPGSRRTSLSDSEHSPTTSKNGYSKIGKTIGSKLKHYNDVQDALPDEVEPLHNAHGTTVNSKQNNCHRLQRHVGGGGGPTNHAAKLSTLVQKHGFALRTAGLLLPKNKDVIKPKETSVQTEQKAAKVLAIIFIIFVLCWLPFFTVNVLTALCKTCVISDLLFSIFLWLGYVSSTINPIIYTIFNKTFRRMFIKIILCQYCEKRKIHKSATFPNANGNSVKIRGSTSDEVCVTILEETVL